MGGEIFSDIIDQKTFEDYYGFYEIIRNNSIKYNFNYQLNFVTNLIFIKNKHLVDDLFEKIKDENVFISTSYDFSGRGLDINKSLIFKKNLEAYKNKIRTIGFVLTRSSIRKLIEDKDLYFKNTLYPNYELFFDFYVPEGNNTKFLPSEKEMLDAFLYIAKNYPKVKPISDLINNSENKMLCPSLNKTTISPNGDQVTCRMLKYKQEDFETKINLDSNSEIIENHLTRNDCLNCDWFNRCGFRCFVQEDWRWIERTDTCFLKTFFDETIAQ